MDRKVEYQPIGVLFPIKGPGPSLLDEIYLGLTHCILELSEFRDTSFKLCFRVVQEVHYYVENMVLYSVFLE